MCIHLTTRTLMTLTNEQLDILDYVSHHLETETPTTVAIEAVAGSGKTSTLVEIANLLDNTSHNLYLAYNKSIAVEASNKFPVNTECKTTHSLAYGPIITHGLDMDGETGSKREVTPFTFRSITENIPYEEKNLIVKMLEKFFLSSYIDIENFLDSLTQPLEEDTENLIKQYWRAMVYKDIAVPHPFYLKLFHILLADELIHYDPWDIVMLDEAGDINPVTLEIFKLLPSQIKVMVGDSQQNIYSFNNTINGFNKVNAAHFPLSQSFRCSPAIAKIVEPFCTEHLNPEMRFIGTENDGRIKSTAIISRTNSGLIAYAIELTKEKIPFKLTRSPYEIFKLVLSLIALHNGKEIYESQYKYLHDDEDEYTSSDILRRVFPSFHSFLEDKYHEDKQLLAGIKLMRTHNFNDIFNAYNYAKKLAAIKTKSDLTLSTAHSSKGLTFDRVKIASDFYIGETLFKHISAREPWEQEELRLAYVTLTRARVELVGHQALLTPVEPVRDYYDPYSAQEIP